MGVKYQFVWNERLQRWIPVIINEEEGYPNVKIRRSSWEVHQYIYFDAGIDE